ncbi:MAG: hypothetical protein J5J06_12660 [Phycisphaerae bacterium]|nr:hypothetical protein [Phycisphaerae bacterium]
MFGSLGIRMPMGVFTVALLLAMMDVDVMAACTEKCERKWFSNLHYECEPAGADCGSGCKCRNVSGVSGFVSWKDCKCKATAAASAGEIMEASGSWGVVLTGGAVAPGSTASFTLQWNPNSEITIFDHFDLTPNGLDFDVTVAQFLDGPTEFTGTFQLSFGAGPPDQIPVEIVQLNLTASSFMFLGQPTGPNTIILGPLAAGVQGNYDSTTGIIQFDDPVPAIGSNSLFPGGKAISLRPALAPNGPGYDLFPSASAIFGGPVPAASEWGLVAMALLVASAATALLVGGRAYGARRARA